MTALSMRVAQIDALTPLIRRLILRTADGSAIPAYTAGAHVELHVPGERPLRRAYSLVTPADGGDRVEIAVQLEAQGSGGSRWVHSLSEGETITVSPPKNLFPLEEAAEEYLLLAGGIGITPILCMARTLAAAGKRYALHYAARDPERAAYCAEVEALEHARCWFDGGDPARGMPLAEVIGAPAAGRHLYVCGPKGFIAAVLDTGRKLGWADANLHCELFTGALDEAGDRPFTVELTTSGITLEVPVGKTVMDVMEEAGLDPMFDCRRGECGICTAKVVAGEADHRDICLSARERSEGGFCTCVSRARSERLVLEL
ncbi:vanillate O-demethylase oxidoreductase [Azoarcus olearius]|uniref:PDR/VanB family oxidoreductase n=1 Tax=Azoarcus sp. (strain BH72) TaxID=418699 RepID=UPI0008062BFB|nr:PDR/VanB family oxidoreductase [Azoarcus olearius]ANQ84289.1 vanillate O-demethylase oxidoreductase [Azoarcus olearius]